jgi:hypothetical protein
LGKTLTQDEEREAADSSKKQKRTAGRELTDEICRLLMKPRFISIERKEQAGA